MSDPGLVERFRLYTNSWTLANSRNRKLLCAVDDRLAAAEARAERYRKALENIVQVYEARSELFTNDEDCAGSLHDRARAALRDER